MILWLLAATQRMATTSKTKPQAIKTRDADRSREAILEAAERLFAAQGLDGTSLADIGVE